MTDLLEKRKEQSLVSFMLIWLHYFADAFCNHPNNFHKNSVSTNKRGKMDFDFFWDGPLMFGMHWKY